ncbi:hypothetical protein Thi970DRAFT_01113 [Thiorhodovibrio frisius]|uniref:Uncharacterized protein n=1 Tax=Thiorhodovibrio frisius TaxID=631362 RepID=H8YYC1_9GAMM|nr:hypothetical protein Thi970DRAFT_01113 [Thiorhodovibrio frisius]WPL23470.1 hypothetical protein Thiofri_03657 [Thiorhodovibrio frisius]
MIAPAGSRQDSKGDATSVSRFLSDDCCRGRGRYPTSGIEHVTFITIIKRNAPFSTVSAETANLIVFSAAGVSH